MKSSALGFIPVALLLLGGCAGHAPQEPATAILDDYARQVAALETGMKAHAAQVAAMMDAAAMGPMEQAHSSFMAAHLGDMDQDVAMMETCTDAHGGTMTTGLVGTLVQQAGAECMRHLDAMTHAADMSAAMAEENAHQATMGAMMQQMMQMQGDSMMRGSMMGGGSMMGAGTYSCATMNAP
jgi:hypothetical protein